jgi:WD40 repeat protein
MFATMGNFDVQIWEEDGAMQSIPMLPSPSQEGYSEGCGISRCCFNYNGSLLAVSMLASPDITLIEVGSWSRTTLSAHKQAVRRLEMSKMDNKMVSTEDRDGMEYCAVLVWDLDASPIAPIKCLRLDKVWNIALVPNSNLLAVLTDGRAITVWNWALGKTNIEYGNQYEQDRCEHLDVSFDGMRIATGTSYRVVIRDLLSGRRLVKWTDWAAGNKDFYWLQFSRDGRKVISVYVENIAVHDSFSGECLLHFVGVHSFAAGFHPSNENTIVVGSFLNRRLKFFDIESCKKLAVWRDDSNWRPPLEPMDENAENDPVGEDAVMDDNDAATNTDDEAASVDSIDEEDDGNDVDDGDVSDSYDAESILSQEDELENVIFDDEPYRIDFQGSIPMNILM